ncbi:MAG: site-2 protease family protein [Dehalococcoidia bacterium]|nr:site-2 protease family protein [Dehalococcoidia bacterium]
MDITGGFQIAKVRGISILVHWSWSLIFTLLTWTVAQSYSAGFEEWSEAQAWVGGAITAIVFFLSVLLHELSHAFVAQGYGLPVPSITLFIFGGVSSIAAEMKSARQEFFVAAAGPAMSFLLAVLFMGSSIVVGGNIGSILFYLGFVNGVLGVFNLLPGFPLDGGRVFRAIMWGRTGSLAKATRIASRVGVGIAWVMIAIGVVVTLTLTLFGLWWIFIGLFLKQAADAAYGQLMVDRALARIRVRDLMRPPPEPMPESSSVQVLVDERILAKGDRCILLERQGRVTGLLTTTDLAKVPRDAWMTTSARTAMAPAEQVATVPPGELVTDAVRVMAERDIHQMPVIDQGQLVGLLTRGDILNHIQTRMQFGEIPPAPDEAPTESREPSEVGR